MTGAWCGETLRLVVSGFPLCEVLSLLEGIVVLLLLDGISDGLEGRLGRRHGRIREVGVERTSRRDSGSDSKVTGAESGSAQYHSRQTQHACAAWPCRGPEVEPVC